MAPRSSGCRTCVRRRVKCDETRPFCERCQKARVPCPGFRVTFVFVDETDETARTLDRFRGSVDDSGRSSSASKSTPLDPGSGSKLSIPSEDVHITYLLARFVATGTRYVDHTSNSTWMSICLAKPEQYPIATSAIKCLATTFFGRQQHANPIMIDAAHLYGQNLRQLSQALQGPRTVWTFDVLAATTALAYYE